MDIFVLIIAAAVGYALGSLNMGIIVGAAYGVDIRQRGSGNAGLTNARRHLPAAGAAMVFAGDVLKAVLACFLGHLITSGELGPERFIDLENPGMGMMFAGTACVVGHVFPVFFQFRGGKGVLTSIAVVSLMDIRVALILLAIFIVTLLLSRFVSLGSILAALCLPIVSAAMGKPEYFLVYCVAISALVIAMHRGNIIRLINRTEPRIKQLG